MDWRDKPPDLNIVENPSNWFLKNVYKDYRQFDYPYDIREALVDAEDKIPQEDIKIVIDSIPADFGNVAVSKGSPTKY